MKDINNKSLVDLRRNMYSNAVNSEQDHCIIQQIPRRFVSIFVTQFFFTFQWCKNQKCLVNKITYKKIFPFTKILSEIIVLRLQVLYVELISFKKLFVLLLTEQYSYLY